MSAGRRRVAVVVGVALAMACAGRALAAGEDQSLFDAKRYKPLVAEEKAGRKGDVLTIVVQENASATSSADLRAQRKLGASIEIDAGHYGSPRAAGAAGADSDSGGRTQRSGRLLATLSVRVVDVNDNGDLVVAGNQMLSVNGEVQSIALTGIVRPRDIGDNNTVPSTRLADARIEFDGAGFISDKSKPSWVSRVIALLGF